MPENSFEVILLCLVAAFLLRKAGVFIPSIPTSPLNPAGESKGSMGTMTAVAWCWLAPTSVMTVFIALNGATASHWERLFDSLHEIDHPRHVTSVNSMLPEEGSESPDDEMIEPILAPAALLNSPEPPDSPEPPELVQNPDLIQDRPEWTREEDQTTDEIRRVVLKSGPWSTEQEAIDELRSRTGALVRQDFERRHHRLLDPEGIHFLTDDRAVNVAVKERYVERVDHDFQKFTSPMNTVWWQVELSPVVRSEIYPAWKAAVVQNRVITIGSLLAILTLLANEGALFARLKRKPNGNTIRAALVTAGSITAWIAAELFVTSRILS